MRTPLRGLAPLLLALLALAAPASAATTHHVNTQSDGDDGACAPLPGGDCTVREAIEHSVAGDTVAIPAGTYQLTSSIDVNHALTIEGEGRQTTMITGNSVHRVFWIHAGAQVIRRLRITGGNADGEAFGGGIYNTSNQPMRLEDTTVNNNTVNFDGPLAITQAGGGGVHSTGPVTVERGSFDTNAVFMNFDQAISTSGGGAIWAGGKLTLRNTELHDNAISLSSSEVGTDPAVQNGGGAVYANGGLAATGITVTQHNATMLAGNGAPMENGGGGIYANGGDVTITNSTIHNNTAHIDILAVDNGGGGLYSHDATTALTNVTLTGSFTRGGTGGGVYREDGTVTARNTIIAGNKSDPAFGDGTPDNCDVAITSAGHNLESANTCGFNGAGDLRNTDPKLGALGANGGATRTRPLLKGSPAIDAGSGCPAVDQRGVPRPRGRACDIGAVEAPVPTVATGPFKKRGYGSALLTGTVNPGGRATSYVFQYGRTNMYGKTTGAKGAGAGTAAAPASIRARNLKPNKTYHYRLLATNPVGVSVGADRTFRTRDPGKNPFRLPSAKTCISLNRMKFLPRRPGGTRVVRIRVFVNGEKAIDRDPGTKRVKVEDLPADDFQLKVVGRYSDGPKITRERKITRC